MNHCDYSRSLRSVDNMLDELLTRVKPIKQSESLPITEALGRILALPVISQVDVPPYDNSAMDGYVIHIAEQNPASSKSTLAISQRIPAGAVPQPLASGTAARIFTGATIPENANAVIMQEQCSVKDGRVVLPAKIQRNQNIRPRGQDICAGQTILPQGHQIKPQDLGLLASIGVDCVKVFCRLKVAILSTGDELIEPGQPLSPGKIYNSNRYTLKGLLTTSGLNIIDMGIIEDTHEATVQTLSVAADQADVIITSGGVSVGEEDHIKAAIEELGSLDLWRLAIKPGKPFALGQVNNTPIIGLPGNPGAVFVTFCILARPYLLALQGATIKNSPRLSIPIGFSIEKAGTRREYLRVRLTVDSRGKTTLQRHSNQSSGVLSSASWADGFAVIMENTAPQMGEPVNYIPFSELMG